MKNIARIPGLLLIFFSVSELYLNNLRKHIIQKLVEANNTQSVYLVNLVFKAHNRVLIDIFISLVVTSFIMVIYLMIKINKNNTFTRC